MQPRAVKGGCFQLRSCLPSSNSPLVASKCHKLLFKENQTLTRDSAPAIYIQNVKLTFSLISGWSFFFFFPLLKTTEGKKSSKTVSEARLHNPLTGKTLIKLKAAFLLLKLPNLLLHCSHPSPLSYAAGVKVRGGYGCTHTYT